MNKIGNKYLYAAQGKPVAFLVQRLSDKKFVARPGSKRSYTSGIFTARHFKTRAEALTEMCLDSEQIIELRDVSDWIPLRVPGKVTR